MQQDKQSNENIVSYGQAKRPTEKKWKCKNHMLEAINNMQNLGVNGSKDSQYNDLILFEDMFENWDQKGILLTKWEWRRSTDEPYVYITPMGIYTDIGIFARKLQRILNYNAHSISVIMMGDDLHITEYPDEGRYDNSTTYEAMTLHIDQIDSGFYVDGWKLSLPENKDKENT